MQEFPASYYTLMAGQGSGLSDGIYPRIQADATDSLPVPANSERARALISFGLYDEARKELASSKTRGTDVGKSLGSARLYLEMDDYNGAFRSIKSDFPRPGVKERQQILALQYPLPYSDTVSSAAASSALPLPLVYAIIRAESSYSPVAISSAGAVGLMQLMPSTAAQMNGKTPVTTEQLTDPAKNISFGVRHMKDLISQYHGDVISAVAAYNAGSTPVNRWRREFGHLPTPEFIEQIPYGETREYVKKVLAATLIYARLYNLSLGDLRLPFSERTASLLQSH
jgi:soluble lytic murein transglycosylase